MVTKKRPEKKATSLAGYGKALTLLQKQEFKGAKEALEKFLSEYPDRDDIRDRARQYFELCEREISPKKPKKTTADDFSLAGIIKLNNGEVEEGLADLARAAEMDPKEGKHAYLLALAHAANGDGTEACENLKKAMKAEDRFRIMAANSPDFDALREDEEFIKLMAPPSKRSSKA